MAAGIEEGRNWTVGTVLQTGPGVVLGNTSALVRWQFIEHLADLAGCSINFADELLEAGDLLLHIENLLSR